MTAPCDSGVRGATGAVLAALCALCSLRARHRSRPSPAPAPPPPPVVVAPEPPKPVAAAGARADAPRRRRRRRRSSRSTPITQLQNGDEAGAQKTLEQALTLDPTNDLAKKLMDQIKADPQKELGTVFFRYTVQRDDSLSKIAQQYLGDRFRFHILAKYNDIANPSRLAAGQVIKIPGRAPPPARRHGRAPRDAARRKPPTKRPRPRRSKARRRAARRWR